MDLAIQMAERRKKEYESALQELKQEIERQENLSISMPKFIGIVKVVAGDEMVNYAKIERIEMEVAMAYERIQGRNTEDVSALNLSEYSTMSSNC